MVRTAIIPVAALALAVGLAGCRVRVDKGSNGEDKNVQVDTPFGGVHVNTDQVSASDLGMPVYPGATPVKGDDNHQSADVHLGFGEWQLRVRAVTYATDDSRDQVVAYYKKALGRYGDVLTCEDKKPVGTPTSTSEGLTCSDGAHGKVKVEGNDFDSANGFELKAGSKRHQHIVGFEKSSKSHKKTTFALVALDLPSGTTSNDDKSD